MSTHGRTKEDKCILESIVQCALKHGHQATIDQLRLVFDQFSVDDLQTLVSSSAEPDAVVYAVLSNVHCLLLTLTHTHLQPVIEPLSWTALRLDFLAKGEHIRTKMQRRMRKVAKGKSFLPAQIKSVLVNTSLHRCDYQEEGSEMQDTFYPCLLRVYTSYHPSVASLAAWTYLCLLIPALSTFHLRKPHFSPSNLPAFVVNSSPRFPPQARRMNSPKKAVRKLLPIEPPSNPKKMRIAVKIGSLYALVQFHSELLPNDGNRSFTAQEEYKLVCGVMFIERQSKTRKRESIDPFKARIQWQTLDLPSFAADMLTQENLPIIARKAFLLQYSQSLLYSRLKQHRVSSISRSLEMRVDIKIGIVEISAYAKQLHLLVLGRAIISAESTLRSLHIMLHAKLAMEIAGLNDGSQHLRFCIHGKLLHIDDALTTSVVSCLPFTLICLTPSSMSVTKASKRDIQCFYRQLSQAVWNANKVLDCCPQGDMTPLKLFPMRQRICPTSMDTIITMMYDWKLVEMFYHLKDSQVLYSNMPKAAKVKRFDFETLDAMPAAFPVQGPRMPREGFRPEKEYLHPLYATAHVTSSTTADIYSFNAQALHEVHAMFQTATHKLRLVLSDVTTLIHVTSVCRHKDPLCLSITFLLDESSPSDTLLSRREAYVWYVASIKYPHDPLRRYPPPWLCDVYKKVWHPRRDVSDEMKAILPTHYFHIRVPGKALETDLEATFWSRQCDWTRFFAQTDIDRDVLRPVYDMLCRSHPPSDTMDGVKFAKLMRECGIQPALLTIGEVAYVFTSHVHPNHIHELRYQDFRRSLESITRTYVRRKRSAIGTLGLHSLLFDVMIEAPSIQPLWLRVIESWRIQAKKELLVQTAVTYCGATRIQSAWRRWSAYSQFMNRLAQIKRRWKAAALIQSKARAFILSKRYQNARVRIWQVQMRIKARHELRILREERRIYINRMLSRLQMWFRCRCRILRVWKEMHAKWVARRARALAKRARHMCSRALRLESRMYLFVLYREETSAEEMKDGFEMEIVDSVTSQHTTFPINSQELSRLLQERYAPLISTINSRDCISSEQDDVQKMNKGSSSLQTFYAIVERLRPPRWQCEGPLTVHYYHNRFNTSLGKLCYSGAVKAMTTEGCVYLIARILQRMDRFTMKLYTPATSEWKRWDLSAFFLYRVLQFFQYATPPLTPEAPISPALLSAEEHCTMNNRVYALLRDKRHSRHAVHYLVGYIVGYGELTPTYHLLPNVQNELRKAEEQCRVHLESKYAIFVQACVRRRLAQMKRYELAKAAYRRYFDRDLKEYQYVDYHSGRTIPVRVALRSLFQRDLPPPLDEWVPMTDYFPCTTEEQVYFNPRRGSTSRFNFETAAMEIQRGYRRRMWFGISNWSLAYLVRAYMYHSKQVSTMEYSKKKEALEVHLLQHQWRSALAIYESALELLPHDPPLVIGLGTLLIYSCQYPILQSYKRGCDLVSSIDTDANRQVISDLEDYYYTWSIFLDPTSSEALAQYAVFLQYVRRDKLKASTLYRRALSIDSHNDYALTNYRRLLSPST